MTTRTSQYDPPSHRIPLGAAAPAQAPMSELLRGRGDFSSVQAHEGAAAAAIGAQAYTQGTDVHFGAGVNPMAGGQQLLGHELTHVVQQARGDLFAGQY